MIRNEGKKSAPIPKALLAARAEWHRIARQADKAAIDSSIYRGETVTADGLKTYEVQERLLEIYHQKCAYCESKQFMPDIEHYRPQKGVTGLTSHPGYYWLCYEWSNLLPACTYCNSRRGKWNKFPLADEAYRVSAPTFRPNGQLDEAACSADGQVLLAERAMLLHPELDHPASYFYFSGNGTINGVDTEGRGNASIGICDLNRDTLKYYRKRVIDDVEKHIKSVLLLFLEGRRSEQALVDDFEFIFKTIEGKTMPQAEFSLMAKYVFDNFETLILPLFESPIQQSAVRHALKTYKAQKT